MSVLIIGKEDSSICETAIDFSKENNISFEYKRVPEDISKENAFILAGGMFEEYPAVIINGQYVGSFSEYEEIYHRSKEIKKNK